MKNLSNIINLFLLIILSAVLTACGGGGSESTGSRDDASSRVVEELKISPKNSQAPLYTNLDFQAQAIYSDGTSQNVTQSVVWESGDTSIAKFDADEPSVLRSKAEGTVTITAALGDKSAATTATVSSPELLSLRLSKSDWLLAQGETDSVSANGNYRGDVTRDVTDEVSWASENEGIVTVSNQKSHAGMISSIAVGSTKITASLNGIAAEATVTVGAAALTSIAVSIKDTSVFEGSTSQVSATATYTDGSSKEVTEQVVWLSSDPSAASVSSTGLVSAISTGSVTISAQLSSEN